MSSKKGVLRVPWAGTGLRKFLSVIFLKTLDIHTTRVVWCKWSQVAEAGLGRRNLRSRRKTRVGRRRPRRKPEKPEGYLGPLFILYLSIITFFLPLIAVKPLMNMGNPPARGSLGSAEAAEIMNVFWGGSRPVQKRGIEADSGLKGVNCP